MKFVTRSLFLILFLLPVLYIVIRMFSGIWSFPGLLPETWNLRALEFIRSNRRSLNISIGSSILYSLAAVLLSIFFSIQPALVMARRNFPGKRAVENLMLAPLMVPAVVYALGLFPVMLRTGLSDNFAGVSLVLALSSFPYMFRALVAGFRSYSPDYELVARMLGGTAFRTFRTVHLPQLLPAILSGATVVFLSAFTEYFLVFLIGGGLVPSFSGYLFPLIRASDWSVSSALVLIFLFIPVFLYAVLELLLGRYYSKRGIAIRAQI